MNRLAVLVLVLIAVAAGQGNYRLAEWVIDEGGVRALPPGPAGYVAHGSFHQTTIGLAYGRPANLMAWIGYWHPRPRPGPSHDVCARRIVAPTGWADTFQDVTPTAVVGNVGIHREAFEAYLTIRHGSGRVYLESLPVELAAGDSAVLTFPPVRLRTVGPHLACCSVFLAADTNPQNDTVAAAFKVLVRPPWPDGWDEVRSMPLLPSGRAAKGGAWLGYNPGDNLIYAAKGNRTRDFFAYDPIRDEWRTLREVPLGREGKPLGRGGVGVSDGVGSVYLVKGNNTVGFYRYEIARDSWTQLADVPLGLSGKRVKGGGDCAFVNNSGGQVYLLKGYRNEFYRYDIASSAWESLPSAPAGASLKWDNGSWLVYDGDSMLYAHKSRVHELWRFDVRGDSWCRQAMTGMPVFHRMLGTTKKSKYGGCAARYQRGIFALKGGNTLEFWYYFIDGDSWVELETIPSFGSTGMKRRVKEGADIAVIDCGVCFALKGSKTVEMWRYVPGAGAVAPSPWRSGVAGRSGDWKGVELRLSASPAIEAEPTVSYQVPGPRGGEMEVFDVAGRVVMTRRLVRGSGSVRMPRLSAGVYLVRLTADGRSVDRRLVVCR